MRDPIFGVDTIAGYGMELAPTRSGTDDEERSPPPQAKFCVSQSVVEHEWPLWSGVMTGLELLPITFVIGCYAFTQHHRRVAAERQAERWEKLARDWERVHARNFETLTTVLKLYKARGHGADDGGGDEYGQS